MSYSYAVTHSQSCDFPRRKLAKQPRSSTTPIATKRLLPLRNLRPHPLQNTHSTRICQTLKGICDALRPCDPFATLWPRAQPAEALQASRVASCTRHVHMYLFLCLFALLCGLLRLAYVCCAASRRDTPDAPARGSWGAVWPEPNPKT